MYVLFLPYYSPKNPYQKELVDALEKYQVTVSQSHPITPFPLLNVAKLRILGKLNVLHLHWTSPFLISSQRSRSLIKATIFLGAILFFKVMGIKIVWTVHNLTAHEKDDPELEIFFNRILTRLYDQLIVHCASARQAVWESFRLPNRAKNKVAVIPHGHFLATYENLLSQNQARQQLGLGHQEFVFLYFGQIRPYKGVFQLINTFKKLDHPAARLLIVGQPATHSIRKRLETSCDEDGRIDTRLEFIADEEIQIYMNAANIVVLPFQNILTSSTVLLAMSYGKALIVPRMGCIPETLNDKGGFLYDPQAEDGLLEAMANSLEANLEEMGRYNYQKVKVYQWDKVAQETVEVYKRCFA